MGDFQRTDFNLPLIDLTSDNATNSNNIIPFIDLTGNGDRTATCSPEINLNNESNQYFTSCVPVIDLTGDNDQILNSRIPVIDLTGDNDQILNSRIPVIDLTDDDVQDITNQIQCIDLTGDNDQILSPRISVIDNDVKDFTNQTQFIDMTCNGASISNSTSRNFNLRGTDDKEIKFSTKFIDSAYGNIQDINFNMDLTGDNDQFLNGRMQDIDMINDNVRDIALGLQSFDLIDDKQQNKDDCIGRINPVPDLTNNKDCDNDRGPNIDLMHNDYRRPVGELEISDLSYNYSPGSFSKPVIESNFRNPNHNRTESDSSNIKEMHIDSLNNLQKFHCRKEILENHTVENSFESRKETTLTNPIRKRPEKNYLITEKSMKVCKNHTSDFPKPAHQPVPLRHSFGRSTVNTSPNVPIDVEEECEGQALTVSSIIHRKKLKSDACVSNHDPTKSKNLPGSGKKAFSIEPIEGFLRKLCIFIILTFMGLYYCILMS